MERSKVQDPDVLNEFKRIDDNVQLLLCNQERGDLKLVKKQAATIRQLNFDCYCRVMDGQFSKIKFI